jgi:hypothetical protein
MWVVVPAPKGHFEVHSVEHVNRDEDGPFPYVIVDGCSQLEANTVCDALNVAGVDPEDIAAGIKAEVQQWQSALIDAYALVCPGWATDGRPENMLQNMKRKLRDG